MIRLSNILRNSVIPLTCIMLVGWIDPVSDKNEEGRQLYNGGEYDKAITRFTDTQLQLPGLDALDFNIANTHYKKGKFPEAEKSYRAALDSEDITLKAKTNYNMGNTMYKQGKFNEALDFYRQAIKLTEEESDVRSDETRGIREDAKYNYEFVQKKMEEMKKEQQERQDQEEQEKEEQEKEEQEKEEQQQGEQQSEEEDHDRQQQQKGQEQEKQDKDDKGGQEKDPQQETEKKQSPSQPYEKKEMTKEEAERILDALRQSEGSSRDLHGKEDESAQFIIEKDW